MSNTEMQISADLEKLWAWTGSPGQEPLCCVFSILKGGVRVSQDSLASQGLQTDLPVRLGKVFVLLGPVG